jgi:hypothetical protein
VAAAALRDFCAKPAEHTQRVAATAHSERSERREKDNRRHSSKEGQQRRSSSRNRKHDERSSNEVRIDITSLPASNSSRTTLAPPAAPVRASYDCALESRSATPSSARSSSASSHSGDPGRAVESRSSSPSSSSRSRSPQPHRAHGSRSEGQRISPGAADSRCSSTASRPDFSAMSSDAFERMPHLAESRHEQSHRSFVPATSSQYAAFGDADRPPAVHPYPESSREASRMSVEQARQMLAQTDNLPRWLAAQSFDESVTARLATAGALDLPHVMRLSKAALKGLLGVAHGIRLHMALRDLEAARATLEAASRPSHRSSSRRHRHSKDSRNGHGRSRHEASSRDFRSHARSPSPETLFRELHPPGLHGYCALSDCDLPANLQCSAKHCHIGLCTFHANKLLLTGQWDASHASRAHSSESDRLSEVCSLAHMFVFLCARLLRYFRHSDVRALLCSGILPRFVEGGDWNFRLAGARISSAS